MVSSIVNICKCTGKWDSQLRKEAVNRNQSRDGPDTGFNKYFKAEIMKMNRGLKESMFNSKHS